MMKRLFSATLALAMIFALGAALAADVRMESIEYKGFGILKIEFSRDCEWHPGASFTLTDESGAAIPVEPFGGDEEEAYLYAPEITDGAVYSLLLTLEGTEQSASFTADSALEYRINKSGEVNVREDKEKCDFCRERGHDEDYCPERVNPGDIPADPEGLAWYFDIDLCDRCGGFGHDDDRCRG